MAPTVTITRNSHVAEIRFAQPPHNYASIDLLSKIADAIDLLDDDADIRCIILASEGKIFCAGADLAGDSAIVSSDGINAIARFYEQALRILRRKKPMIAAVQGAAIGAGLGLALVADFRVAVSAARFSANFVRLGFHPGFGITHTLPRLIGMQRASWMMLSAERVNGERALDYGLIDQLAADGNLSAAAYRMAEEIAANAPLALLAVRATGIGTLVDNVTAALRHEYAQQSILKETEDYAEGVASVFERREASFNGR